MLILLLIISGFEILSCLIAIIVIVMCWSRSESDERRSLYIIFHFVSTRHFSRRIANHRHHVESTDEKSANHVNYYRYISRTGVIVDNRNKNKKNPIFLIELIMSVGFSVIYGLPPY